MKFKVGDRVVIIYRSWQGEHGIIIQIEATNGLFIVRLDSKGRRKYKLLSFKEDELELLP